jgi:hypothetical protein
MQFPPFSTLSNVGNIHNARMLETNYVDDPIFTIPIDYTQLASQSVSPYTYCKNLIRSGVPNPTGGSLEYGLTETPYKDSQLLEPHHMDQTETPFSSFVTAVDNTDVQLLGSAYLTTLIPTNTAQDFQLQAGWNPSHTIPHQRPLLLNNQSKRKFPVDSEDNDHKLFLEKKKRCSTRLT